MSENEDFKTQLKEALDARQASLERVELPKLKEEFRAFQKPLAVLFDVFLKKGYITEDPYKDDITASGKLCVPDSGPLPEAGGRGQLGSRLTQLENEFDYLVNYYQFNIENFSQEKIKIITGLVKYIDWGEFSPEAGPTTAGVAEITAAARRSAGDPGSLSVIDESISALKKTGAVILNYLRVISDINRERWKCDLRIHAMDGAEPPRMDALKAKWQAAFPSSPFYPQLAEEVLKEDAAGGAALREKVLKRLLAGADKPKAAAKSVDNRQLLIEGLNAAGASGATFSEVLVKISANHELLENRAGFFKKLKKLLAQMTKKNAAPVFYDMEFVEPIKNTPAKERLNYTQFISELEKKAKILSAVAARGSAEKKLEAMEEAKLAELLQRNIKDINVFFKTLTGLDETFKKNVNKADRSRVRGIKPELSTLKSAVGRASQKLFDYNVAKEEIEQFKKLGIAVED